MNKSSTLEPSSVDTQSIESEMDRLLLKSKLIDERIMKDQQEIARLRVSTRKMLDQLQVH